MNPVIPWRIDKRDEANESETSDRIVVRLEIKANGELVFRQLEVAEAQSSFTQTAKSFVCIDEFVFPFVSEAKFFSVDKDGAASFDNAFRSTLHHQNVTTSIFVFVDRDLHEITHF